jgi:hypothetical protein
MSDTTISTTGKTITIAGAGFRHEVIIEDGQTVQDALSKAGVDAEALGVDLLVGGQRVDAGSVSASDVEAGATISAPPKSAALGS